MKAGPCKVASARDLFLSNGLALPIVGLGTYQARGQSVRNAVLTALQAGYRHIDTAVIYQAGIRDSGVDGKNIFLTSKVSPYQQGTLAARQACDSILRELQTDHLDLALIHWPGVSRQSPRSPENARLRLQTWRVLEEFYKAGRFRAIGVSNYEEHHLVELLKAAEVPPAVNQIEVHPFFPNTGLRQFCAEKNIAVVAYSTLGSTDNRELLGNKEVGRIATAHGKSSAQILLRWALQSGCAVIPKSVTAKYIRENAEENLLSWQLSEADMAALGRLENGTKYCWDPVDVA